MSELVSTFIDIKTVKASFGITLCSLGIQSNLHAQQDPLFSSPAPESRRVDTLEIETKTARRPAGGQ
jgi:hypothetical protein